MKFSELKYSGVFGLISREGTDASGEGDRLGVEWGRGGDRSAGAHTGGLLP